MQHCYACPFTTYGFSLESKFDSYMVSPTSDGSRKKLDDGFDQMDRWLRLIRFSFLLLPIKSIDKAQPWHSLLHLESDEENSASSD
uniref:Uncharacterized protein n=1 Tax=Panagrellus redivivus TaxID=6233 RepID=A0A7E4ZRX8_PANRE